VERSARAVSTSRGIQLEARFERGPTILKPQSKDPDGNDEKQGCADRVLLEGRA
jgi:hypothetical protein